MTTVMDGVESRESLNGFAPIGALAGQTGEWRRRGVLSRVYDLTLGDHLYSTLRMVGALRRTGELSGADGAWEIRRCGFWVPGLAIHRAGQDQAFAELERTMWGHGTLQFASGARYHWRRVSLWGGRYEFLNDMDRTLVAIRGSTFHSRRRMVLDVAPDAARSHELTVLAGVACYLRLLVARRAH